jgi:hypothetical protein
MLKFGMLSLMDAQARDQWNKSLDDGDLPEISEDTFSAPLSSYTTAKLKSLSGVCSMCPKV